VQNVSGVAYKLVNSDVPVESMNRSDEIHMRLMAQAEDFKNLLIELNPDRLTINDFHELETQLSDIHADLVGLKALQTT
jgi:hypothetical protein